jgi:hypothetical protein
MKSEETGAAVKNRFIIMEMRLDKNGSIQVKDWALFPTEGNGEGDSGIAQVLRCLAEEVQEGSATIVGGNLVVFFGKGSFEEMLNILEQRESEEETRQ